jgi:PleD family two-component response regulator
VLGILTCRWAAVDRALGLLEARPFLSRLAEELQAAASAGQPTAVLCVTVRPALAEPTAAARPALRRLGRFVRSRLRALDSATVHDQGRLAVLLPGTRVEGAAAVADRLRGFWNGQDPGALAAQATRLELHIFADEQPGGTAALLEAVRRFLLQG